MKVEVYDRHFANGKVAVNISFLRWLQLKLQGYAPLRRASKLGWRGKLMFYVVKCKVHGYYLDYPHGFRSYFTCPLCVAEEKS